ncbi:membrane dipeptidase-domain-containing protein [Cercophora newfieldiana]|uniref:Dipeptidase n=1 Tax=Cercophora newfieldiana TaxID=92897 RepID=A0AA40CUM4_9PEZI|nr:membrane dipeptidase-domain-containing protein [Cercophora newfieldiana]
MARRSEPPSRASRKARACLLLAVLSLFVASLFLGPTRNTSFIEGVSRSGRNRWQNHKSIEDRVKHILEHTPLIDGHNDLAIFLRAAFNNHIYSDNFTGPFLDGTLPYHTDLARLRKGQVGGAFWSVFWPCPSNGQDYSDANYLPVIQSTLSQIDVIARLKAAYPDDFSPALTASTSLSSFHHHNQLISPLGIEGLHQIGNSASTLRRYFDLGVRYATLTHNCGNRFADAALWENPFRKAPSFWGGVSPEGRLLINEMNRLGMIVDLSHTSVETQMDVLGGSRRDGWEGSKAPVIFSHSSVFGLCPHPRNVEDRVLRLVKERGSLVMINFAPDFVSCVEGEDGSGIPVFYPGNSTLEHVAEHIMYVGRLIGFEHVGLGSDFDGIEDTPRGLEDVSKYPDLFAELLRRGVIDEDAAKVAGGNMLRVWGEVEAVAKRLQKAGEPILEDDLPSLW